jgi:hypothetical protein
VKLVIGLHGHRLVLVLVEPLLRRGQILVDQAARCLVCAMAALPLHCRTGGGQAGVGRNAFRRGCNNALSGRGA